MLIVNYYYFKCKTNAGRDRKVIIRIVFLGASEAEIVTYTGMN